MLLTETWNHKHKNVNIENYEVFSCPRPKYNKKAKRYSGGVVIYYKTKFSGHIELINLDEKGIVWIKLKKTYFGSLNDIYIYVVAIYRLRILVYIKNEILHYLSSIFLISLKMISVFIPN